MSQFPKHPPRLTPFQKYDPPLWFVTFGTLNRLPILANDAIHNQFLTFGKKQSGQGIAIGRYVIMPDHIHLFIRLAPCFKLGTTIGFLKKSLSAVITQNGHSSPHWQTTFFDHLVRNASSYSEKWDYVYQNPVRAELVEIPETWPYSGQIVPVRY